MSKKQSPKKNIKTLQLNVRVTKSSKDDITKLTKELHSKGIIKRDSLSECIRTIPTYVSALEDHVTNFSTKKFVFEYE